MTKVTRDNIKWYVDNRRIQVHMNSGNWWDVRSNGKVRRWKREPDRIEVPVKMGIRGFSTITASDFGVDGTLTGVHFRVKPETMT